MKAVWNGVVIAESDNTVVVEGNHYFPADSVNRKWFSESSRTSVCPWKGTANYYDLTDGDGVENKNAAWYYPNPKDSAKNIKKYVAFYPVVQVTK
jgi:uncharacterized protein (DUF427 family)